MAALSFFNELDMGRHALSTTEYPKKDSFPIEFLDQTTMGACLRAVRLDDEALLHPSPITFLKAKKHIPVVQKYLREAQEKLVSLNTTVPWPYLPSFSATFNQSALAYKTMLDNNLWMHAVKRLRTVINAEIGPLFLKADKGLKSSRSYIHNKLFRDIVGATMKTNIELYKNKDDIKLYADQVLESVAIKDMIKEHKAWLYNAFENPKTKLHYTDGVLSETSI
jgi:2-succinyl-5-enolpyruvyl-6-hydroxy-3-cyclohexene-1-carboxylate synthase